MNLFEIELNDSFFLKMVHLFYQKMISIDSIDKTIFIQVIQLMNFKTSCTKM